MRLATLGLLLLFPLQEPAHPMDKGLEPLTSALLKEYLTYLASDELEGRCAGFPGNDLATEFIAKKFREAGLKPVGDKDDKGGPTYWQRFTIRRGELTTRNCAGLLEGRDPVLKDEIVVVGAHHDHVGRKGQQRAGQLGSATKEDEIWNGADDNGSGTTALLGVAKAFAAAGARPRRSILFLTFSAEEWGLLGSRHYVSHPLFPLDKTVTMLNMDMVGRTATEGAANAYGLGTVAGDAFRPIVEAAAKRAGLSLNYDSSFGDGSDHVSFYAKGVPILGLSERGPCPDYHKVTDHAEKIDYGTMEKIARTAALTLFDIADFAGSLRRNPEFKRPVAPDSGKPRLGAYLESVEGEALARLALGEGRGAMSVNGFIENSVAETGGVREGDIIVSFNGETFSADAPREKLTENLDKIARGKPVPLELVRGGKRFTVQLTWPPVETK